MLSQAALDQRISALASPLASAAARDIARWPFAQVFTNPEGYTSPTAAMWEGQVQAIREWLVRRLAWMDAQLP